MKIQNLKLKNLKLVVRNDVVEFDGEGIAVVDEKLGQALLGLPNYNTVDENPNLTKAQGDDSNEAKEEEAKNTQVEETHEDDKEEIDLNSLSVADLKALADQKGLDYDSRIKKADLIELLA